MLSLCRRTPCIPSLRTRTRICPWKLRPCLSSSSSSACEGGAVKLRNKPQSPVLTQKASLELSRKRWLTALSPFEQHKERTQESEEEEKEDLAGENEGLILPFLAQEGRPNTCGCVLGIDPDISGALAVIRSDDLNTVEVFDVPSVHVVVGSQNRRRHDARSIAELLKKLDAPPGSIAYLEQSMPLPKDGKQGWWGSGFGFGIWIGSLVASGFTVVPVPPAVWKRAMEVSGAKDNSRESASLLFPSLSSQLKRKKDHGRAEALLIAAYGKGISPPTKDINTEVTEYEVVTPL